jgi:hypothetical protein
MANLINCLVELLALFSRPGRPTILGNMQEDTANMPPAVHVQQSSPAPVGYEIE